MFSSLTGCSIVAKDNTKALEQKAISVGEKVLSKQEVVDLWYSFYNQNSSVFYYYSEEDIVEIFYKNIVLKYAVLQQVDALIEEEKLVYTQGDDAKVWLQVLQSFAQNVDSIEKSLYLQQGIEEDKLPTRLQSSSSSSSNSDVESYLYEEYHFTGMEDYECKYTPENNTYGDALGTTKVGYDVSDDQIEKVQGMLSTYLYKTEVETDDEIEYKNLDDLKGKFSNTDYYTSIKETTNRKQAFDMYVGKLMLSAKAEGKKLTRTQTLKQQIKDLYISYYETYLQNMYSNYINSLVDKETSDYYTLSDQAIVSRYLQLLGSDIQKYKLEENYIAVVEAKQDNALLLYRYNGEYYYFTVQHLLVAFDDDIKNTLSVMDGNESSASEKYYEIYCKIREKYYEYLGLDSWEDYNNATYRDENGYDVYIYTVATDGGSDNMLVYFDKDWTSPEYADDVEDDQKENGYYYIGTDGKVYLTAEQFDECKKATVKVGTVIEEFNDTYNATISILSAAGAKTAATIKSELETNSSVKYVISEDLINAYITALNNGGDMRAMNHKVYTNLFMRHAFKYSTDTASLGTDLSDYVGMIISGRDDNHTVGGSTYVNEFTDKARELAEDYIDNKEGSSAYADALDEDNFAISDYGIHMIVVNDVFKVSDSAPITGNDILAENIYGTKDSPLSAEQIKTNVENAVAKMKTIYVSASSSQTLYEYMYELVRDELVGDNGTTYTKERNRLYALYIDDTNGTAKADLSNLMTYDELMDAIS